MLHRKEHKDEENKSNYDATPSVSERERWTISRIQKWPEMKSSSPLLRFMSDLVEWKTNEDVNEDATPLCAHRYPDMFPKGWAKPGTTKRRSGRLPKMIVRALQYFFHQGAQEGQRHFTSAYVCEELGNFIRDKKINERGIRESTIKRWMSAESRRNNAQPVWFRKGEPECIWDSLEITDDHDDLNPEDDHEDDQEPVEQETEHEPVLRFLLGRIPHIRDLRVGFSAGGINSVRIIQQGGEISR